MYFIECSHIADGTRVVTRTTHKAAAEASGLARHDAYELPQITISFDATTRTTAPQFSTKNIQVRERIIIKTELRLSKWIQ